jgi:hypothetical protein
MSGRGEVPLLNKDPRHEYASGVAFPGVKRPGREADHLIQFSAEVKNAWKYGGVFISFRTGRLERELQMVQLSATCSCMAIL